MKETSGRADAPLAPGGYEHIPVMADECLKYLSVKRGGVYIDGTIGGAGHSLRILETLGSCGATLIGIDRDETAAEVSAARLKTRNAELGGHVRCQVFRTNYVNIDKICGELGICAVDGILLDLGVSSEMLDDTERGFSFRQDGPLDMRMDRSSGPTAAEIVNRYSERELTDIILDYGEERWAARIAAQIVLRRAEKPIETTYGLAGAIYAAIPKAARREGAHPARRTFQALRIAVNGELDALSEVIGKAAVLLNKGGRLCVISFHSLEDRIIKKTVDGLAAGCVCPKDLPVCACGHKAVLKKIERKPVLPSETEIRQNPRSRSAKLRVAEKIT